MSLATFRVAPILACLFVTVLGCADDADGSGGGDDGTTTLTGTAAGMPTGSSSTSGDGGSGGGTHPPGCGDGTVEAGEGCDDGNTMPGDGCDGACAVEDGWSCAGSPSECVRLCGNGVIEGEESCDDENSLPYDGCGPSCVIEAGWICDGEPSSCTEVCGDGFVTVGEGCDDAGTTSGDGCDATCGVEAGYVCSGQPSICDVLCGDGIIMPGEDCDDGNPFAGDGCGFNCQIEPGFICSGAPSACSSVLGDTCAFPVVLNAGANTVYWAASGLEYITVPPACGAASQPDGPDVVMQLTASFTGEVAFSIAKPAGERWHLLVGDGACGTMGSELLCMSELQATTLSGAFPVTAGQTYHFYIVDTATGSLPLSSPLEVMITETPETCGDGDVLGNETCDDGGLISGDGCSATCQIEPGYACVGEPSACIIPAGEDCASSIALSAGSNTVTWSALQRDYFTSPPPCSGQLLAGPDVVMHYTATVSGELDFSIAKPTSQRWHLLVNDEPCGTPTPALTCVSDFANTAMSGTITITAGSTYYFYLVDSSSGALPLSNPLTVTITETAEVCGDGVLFGNETCDDGNTGSGDGCSSLCAVEPTYVCQGQPSVCFVPPCAPGTNGMIGNTVTTLSTDLPPGLTENYIAVDSSPTGWIYIGGQAALHRVPKSGGPSENVGTAAGLTAANLGYAMLVDGPDIFTVEAKGSTTAGHIWRISADGGVNWAPTDYATLPAVPTGFLQSATSYGGQLYTLTNQVSTTIPTQLYKLPLGGPPPVLASLELTFPNEARCSGIALDDDFLYAACGTGERLLRVDRVTGAVTVLSTAFNLDINSNSLFSHDVDADGSADYLYFKGGEKRIGFVCDPGGASPYVAELVTYGAVPSAGSFGLGFDPTTLTLYAFDDATEEIVIIQ